MNDAIHLLRQPQPMPEWRKLLEVCEQKGIKPDVVVRPADYREGRHVSARAGVLKELRKAGWTIQMIRDLCPISERNLIRLTKKD